MRDCPDNCNYKDWYGGGSPSEKDWQMEIKCGNCGETWGNHVYAHPHGLRTAQCSEFVHDSFKEWVRKTRKEAGIV